MYMCLRTVQNLASKTPLGLAELPQPWVNNETVAIKPGRLGKGYMAGTVLRFAITLDED